MTHTETILTAPGMVLSSTPSLQDFKVKIARYSLPGIKPKRPVAETEEFPGWLHDPRVQFRHVDEGSYSPEHKSTAVVFVKDLDDICNHPDLVAWQGEDLSGPYEVAVTSALFDTTARDHDTYFLPMIDLVDPGDSGSWEETFERLKHGPFGPDSAGEWMDPVFVWSGKAAHMYWPEPRPSVEWSRFLGWLVKQAARGAAIDLIWLGCALERGYLSLRLTGNIKPLPMVVDVNTGESLDDICETLCLTSIPGVAESIKEGMGTSTDIDW